MSKLPSMPFLVERYIADTRHLSLEEHGAYLLLLFNMWQREGFLPDIDADNARLLSVPIKHWLKLKERLAPFLIAENGRLTQNRLQHQWNRAIDNRNKAAANGKKGGQVFAENCRALSHMKQSKARAPALAKPEQPLERPPLRAPEQTESKTKSIYISKNNTTTSQEDRGADEDFTSVKRLLTTKHMQSALAK